MSEVSGGLVLSRPARNFSPWYQWMERLASTVHEDPLPEADPLDVPAWLERRRRTLDDLLGPVPGPVAPRRARAHPRLWAAWVVSGDPGLR